MNEGRAAGTGRVLSAPPGLFAALLLLAAAAPAEAGNVAVLRSSDLGIYVQAAGAFRAAYGPPALDLSLDHTNARETIEKLRNARPEVVVAIGLRAASLVRDEMPRTSMVFCLVPSPARHQMVGSRITGISADIPPALELDLLRTAAPDVRKIGVVVGPRSENWLREARAAGERLGLSLRVAKIESIEQLGPQVRELAAESDALWLPADPDVATPEAFRFTLGEALQRRRPLLVFSPGLVRSGAFAAAAPDLEWIGARTAEAVRRIQSGERASDIPVLAIRQVRLVTNLKTARALGRELPGPALSGAEVVR